MPTKKKLLFIEMVGEREQNEIQVLYKFMVLFGAGGYLFFLTPMHS